MIIASILRLTLVFVLSASPLVSSAMAASTGQWSTFWGNPLSGAVQAAEEEEVGHDAADLAVAVKAVLDSEVGHALPSKALAYGAARAARRAPPPTSDPLPPPEAT